MQYLLAFVAGILNTLQAGSNSTLNDKLGAGPVIPAIVVYLGGIVAVLAVSPFIGRPIGEALQNAAQVPWWGWIGGVLGAVYVVTTLTTAQSMGAGAFTAVTVTAAVVTSLVLDHFGWLGFKSHSINLLRLTGGSLMIVGVVLVARF